MKKSYLLYYALLVGWNLLPVIPMSLKGASGIAFIIVSSVWLSYKNGMLTSTLLVVFGWANYLLGINVDYRLGTTTMLLGSLVYYMTAHYLGVAIDKLRKANKVLTDEIQRRKDTEEELHVKLKLIEGLLEEKILADKIVEYDKMKTEFFANISHELRTPLNVILGSVQLVEMYSRSNTFSECQGKIIRNIAIMRQNCYRLLRLVNNLIDITKIDASSFELHLKNHNIVNIIEEITLSVSEYVESKGISLVFDTDIEEKTIACDAEKIERIMLNLLSNAVKFTPKCGNIYVSLQDKGDKLGIRVSDSGIGIPEDKLDEIFLRFCQIDNILSREHEGSGIGLNLVKSLVEMHGGTISVGSQLEKGTVFNIDLPVRTIAVEEDKSMPAERHGHVERIQIEFSDIYSVC